LYLFAVCATLSLDKDAKSISKSIASEITEKIVIECLII